MRKTLIAIASAGLLASGAAAARTTTVQFDDHHLNSAEIVPVQYYDRSDNRYDRWNDRAGNINDREARITERIQRGQRDGRITDSEARRLYRELSDIEAKERAFVSDGRISGREQAELNRDLDRLREHVREQARDEDRY